MSNAGHGHPYALDHLRHLGLEMGYPCNVRCSMCTQVDFKPRPKYIDDILFRRTESVFGNLDSLTISGGEPTIIPAALRLLTYIHSHHPRLRLLSNTNGIRFTGIWEDVFLAQGECLNISLMSANPSTYERIVQFGDLTAAAALVERLVKRRNSEQSSLKIRVSSVIMKYTVAEMADFIEWAGNRGVDWILFAEDFRGLTTSYSIGEIRHFIEQAYTIADRFPQLQITGLDGFDDRFSKYCRLPVIRPEVALKRKTPSCRAPWDSLFINPYGYAYPCPNTSYFFGNLVQRPLEEVWNSHAAQVFRKRLAAYDHRDCFPGCAENARPVNLLYHDIRKAVWIARRDPKHFLQKGLRRLGLTNAHLKTKISA